MTQHYNLDLVGSTWSPKKLNLINTYNLYVKCNSMSTLRCREERYPCTPVCAVSNNLGNFPQMAAPRMSREIDQST